MSSNFHHNKMISNMHEHNEAVRARPMRKMMNNRRSATLRIRTISLCIVASAIAMLILFWVTRSEFNLAVKDSSYNVSPFPIAGVVMLLGLMFLIIGLAIVADLALGLSDRLQHKENAGGFHQDLSRMDNEATTEMMTTSKVIARIIAAVISLFMLLWAIYKGFRLATEPRRDSKYNQLAFSIGIVTIAFGLVYFIIGIAIIKELVQDLSGRLQLKEKGNWHSMR